MDGGAAGGDDLSRHWREFKDTGSRTAREELIFHYASLAKDLANQVAVDLPTAVEQEDLVAFGFFGLIDALEHFDLDRLIEFETYAIPRIKRRIIAEVRALD